MALSSPTIRKLVRETFTGANPIQLGYDERDAWRQQIERHLLGLRGVKVEKSRVISDSRRTEYVCEISLQDLSGHNNYRSRNHFDIIRSTEGQLTLRYGWRSATPISDLDELVTFINACTERLQRQALQKQKRQKVRDIQTQAVISQVKQFAQEEEFDFNYGTDTVKLILNVKLSDKEYIRIQIPFNKFSEVFPNLRAIIRSAQELHEQGIKFKMQNISRWDRFSRDGA